MPTERFEIVITSKGSRTVKRDFDAVAKSADRTGTAAKRTGRTIDTSMRRGGTAARQAGTAYRRTARDIDRVGQSGVVAAGRVRAFTKSLVVPAATNASLLTARRNVRGLLGAFSAFYAVRFIGETADSFTRMNNALKGFGVAANSVDRIRTSINALSNDARVDAEQATVLFGRLRLATRDLGITEKGVLEITATINKALRLSGSSALEASQSIRQLSQAFNKGKLDGDEFRSVLENAPILTRLLSKELGISKRELRKWAEEGKISVRTLASAIMAGKVEIEDSFKALKGTLGDAFKVLNNRIREFVGQTPAFSASMRGVIKLTQIIGENLSTILGLLTAIAGVKVGKTLVAFAASLGGGTAAGLSALAAATSAAPAAAVAAAGVAGGAGAAAGFPAVLAGPGSRRSFGAFGTNVRSSAGAAIPGTTQAIKTATTESRGLTAVVTGGLGSAFKSVLSVITRIAKGIFSLTKPLRIIQVILTAIALKFGGGFLDGLKGATGETTKWGAALKAVSLTWQIISRHTKTAMSVSGGALGDLFRYIGGQLNVALTFIARSWDQFLRIVGQLLAEAIRMIPESIRGEKMTSFAEWLGPAKNLKTYMDWERLYDKLGDDFTKRTGEIKFIKDKEGRDTRTPDMTNGVFGQVRSGFGMVGDAGKWLGEWAGQFLETQKTINSFREAFESAEESATNIKALLNSKDGAGSFLKPDEIEGQIATLESLLELYDPARIDKAIGEGNLTAQDISVIETAEGALRGITEFLKDAGEELTALDAEVRKATGSEDELKLGLKAFEEDIKKIADKLPPAAKASTIEAANKIIETGKTLFAAGGVAMGTALREGLLQGFGGIAGDILNKTSLLQRLGGSASGDPTKGGSGVVLPTLTGDQFSEEFGDAGKKPLADARLEAQKYTEDLKELGKEANNFRDIAPDAFKSAGESAKNAANDIQQFFESAFGSLEDALVSFVTTGKLDFKSLINSIIADLARMVIRMLIIKPLMGFFGGLFGFSGGGVVPGFANGGVVKGFATGGVISGFGGAKSDNQLIAASPGEMIINKRATDDNIGALQYINKTGMMPPSPNKQGGIVYAPVINVQSDSGGDGQATAQMIDAAIRRSWDELAIKAQRKGGVLG